MQVNVIKHSKRYLGLALMMVILSLGVFFAKGLNYGIDFSGGNLLQIRYEKEVTLHDINKSLIKSRIFRKSVPTVEKYKLRRIIL